MELPRVSTLSRQIKKRPSTYHTAKLVAPELKTKATTAALDVKESWKELANKLCCVQSRPKGAGARVGRAKEKK